VNETAAYGGARAPFEPPRLTAIELAAEEVVMGSCKLDAQQASGSICSGGGCLGIGS
jgi:hypothetical protein